MKTRILLFTLFILLVLIPMYAQTYHQGDSTALRAIDASCDASNNLNWNTESKPGNWDGVTWDSNTPKRVTQLSIVSKQLTGTMNVSGLTSLQSLYCESNQLTSLNVSGLSNLGYLGCSFNQLISLDVSTLVNLNYLVCHFNQLTILDVSALFDLQVLFCNSNKLTSLDVSRLTKLTGFDCSNNALPFTSLAAGLNVTTFTYSPQNILFTSITLAGTILIDYSAEASINGTATSFTFYKNSAVAETNTTGKFTTTGAGTYYCEMTNVLFSGLTLTTAAVTITSDPATLSVSPSTVNINAPANSSATFNVTSNAAWGITNSTAWLMVSPASSAFNKTITLTAEANPNTTQRTATITVSAIGLTPQTVTVTQAGKVLTLSVSTSTLPIGFAQNSTATFDVTSNIDWNITSSKSWLNVSPASGANFGSVLLTAEANPADTLRRATVTISGTGVDTQIITVTQAARPALSVSALRLNIGAAANNTTTFTITSNTSWGITSSQPWLTVSPVNGSNNDTITLTATSNPSITTRTATAMVEGVGVEPLTITVTQAAKGTDVNEVTENNCNVYPNPVKNTLNVSFSSVTLPATIGLYTMEGKELVSIIIKTFFVEIDMENYRPGMYILKIISPAKIIERKILKQ